MRRQIAAGGRSHHPDPFFPAHCSDTFGRDPPSRPSRPEAAPTPYPPVGATSGRDWPWPLRSLSIAAGGRSHSPKSPRHPRGGRWAMGYGMCAGGAERTRLQRPVCFEGIKDDDAIEILAMLKIF